MSKVLNFLAKTNDVILCVVNKWWRPTGYVVIIAAMAANTIFIPFLTKTGVPLKELSVLILAFAPLAGLRTYEKMKDPNDPLGQDPNGPSKNEADAN